MAIADRIPDQILGDRLHVQAVQALLGALPLKEDFDEAAPVYSTLSQLISDGAMSQKLGGQLANILQVSGVACLVRWDKVSITSSWAGCQHDLRLSLAHVGMLLPGSQTKCDATSFSRGTPTALSALSLLHSWCADMRQKKCKARVRAAFSQPSLEV